LQRRAPQADFKGLGELHINRPLVAGSRSRRRQQTRYACNFVLRGRQDGALNGSCRVLAFNRSLVRRDREGRAPKPPCFANEYPFLLQLRHSRRILVCLPVLNFWWKISEKGTPKNGAKMGGTNVVTEQCVTSFVPPFFAQFRTPPFKSTPCASSRI
jgi:hypothetical protein